jgi:hypothetical protein
MITVENNLPKTYVVSDTKINTQTLEKLLADSNKSYLLKNWGENNKEPQKISSLEKHLEILGRYFELYSDEKYDNTSYFKEVLKNNYSNFILQHANVNIVFTNISINFLMILLRLQESNMALINNKLGFEKLGFWLPPIMDQNSHKDASLKFGLACSNLAKSIDELLTYYNYSVISSEDNLLAEKLRSNIVRLLPISTQLSLGINCSILAWRQLLIKCTDFSSEDELRYVFMNLAKDLKVRYYSLFQDCVLEDSAGKTYGLDTLKTDDKMWYRFKLKFKLEQ